MDDPRNRSTLRSLKESGISLLRFMFTGHPFQVFAVSLAELMFLFYAWVMAGIPALILMALESEVDTIVTDILFAVVMWGMLAIIVAAEVVAAAAGVWAVLRGIWMLIVFVRRKLGGPGGTVS